MDRQSEEISIAIREATAADILPFASRAVEFDTMGGQQSAADLIKRGRSFVLSMGGKAIAGYTLQANGEELHITAAAGEGGDIDFTALIFGLIDEQAQNFRSVAFQTMRPGLVRKAERHGYEVAGIIMRKVINK